MSFIDFFVCLDFKYHFKKYNPKLVSGLKHYPNFLFSKYFFLI